VSLFILGLAWAAGIFLAENLQLSVFEWGMLSVPPLLAGWLSRRQVVLRMCAWSLAFFFLGASRLALAQPRFPPSHIRHENDSGRLVQLTGVIKDDPDRRDRSINLVLELEATLPNKTTSSVSVGRALVQASPDVDISYGDRVIATGYLQTPPDFEDFSYRQFLAIRGIHSMMSRADVVVLESRQASPLLMLIFAVRSRAKETIYALYPDPEASLMAGILLGIESGISPELQEAFNRTGTSHIIAISGFNITIMAAVAIYFFGRVFGSRRGLWLAGAVIILYTLFVGADASVVRAAIMGSLALFARFIGRQTQALASLAAAALLMTVINPNVLWDVGFQLSFAASMGLILFADPMKAWFTSTASRLLDAETATRLSAPVSEFVLFTFAAQIPTLPLSAIHFQALSPISLIANPLVLPVQPALMMLGGLATLMGLVWIPIAQPIAWLSWPLPAFTIRIADVLADVPSGSIEISRVGPTSFVLLLGALAVVAVLLLMSPDWRRRLRTISSKQQLPLLFSLAILTALAWIFRGGLPDGQTHVTVITSEAILIESPTGRFALIGGGSSPVALSQALGVRLPLFHREIDWVVPSGDRLIALESNIGRFKMRNALLAPFSVHIEELLAQAAVPFQDAQVGQLLDLGGGATLRVESIESDGIALVLSDQNARILILSGAISPTIRSRLTAVIYQGANASDLPSDIDPQFFIISLSEGAHFDGDVLENAPVFRTDHNGWIQLSTDGELLRMTVERLP
jgi:competence protein ComEC